VSSPWLYRTYTVSIYPDDNVTVLGNNDNYIIGSNIYTKAENGKHKEHPCLLSINRTGVIQWQRILQTRRQYFHPFTIQDKDGSFFMGCGNTQFHLFKVSLSGEIIWTGVFAYGDWMSLRPFYTKTNDGILIGLRASTQYAEGDAVAEDNEYLFFKVDDNGYIPYKTILSPMNIETSVIDTINATKSIEEEFTGIKSIISSSYIDYKNMYLPDKIFDNNPGTGWLESAEGPGIGEKIILKLGSEITIDELKIMPGYFDPRWWASNNRVKKLFIDFGTESYNAVFRDEMKIQSVKLPKEISFKSVTFIIKDVYVSGKDNDTGMSEIQFWHKGEQVDIAPR
jgi:hypothetical protein